MDSIQSAAEAHGGPPPAARREGRLKSRRTPGSNYVEDRWHVTKDGERVRSSRYGQGRRWRARWVDPDGDEKSEAFEQKVKAQRHLAQMTASIQTGSYVDPAVSNVTVREWCDRWLQGYAGHRSSTVRSARTHIALINLEFGGMRLHSVKPSHVKRWTSKLQADGRAPSYVYAVYRRFAQIMGDAVHDDLIRKSPCSRRTAPQQGGQRPYVATTVQVWGLYEAFPEHLRPAVLLGAFVGLRVAEAAALRVGDVDFLRGIVSPAIQYPREPLKTETSRTPVPIPNDLALLLTANVERFQGSTIVTNEIGHPGTPWAIERAMRVARSQVDGLPPEFRFHDLRHYLASLLINAGLDVKVVQHRLRHKNATTTLNVYGHMFPDADESARSAIAAVLASRADSLRTTGS
ncbi:tyrosine-type recombinase/integrase [Ornithinimicrobium sp. LYQ121]|uniref:tyrosine-type recombinase/integrase n=1 Tax=Ornithinimicrobium sp. LYQ121 TaxID=3378801 RepID=UPI003851F6D0